jgi:hypothetical protein
VNLRDELAGLDNTSINLAAQAALHDGGTK